MNNHLQKFVEKRFRNGISSLPEREQIPGLTEIVNPGGGNQNNA